MSSIFTSRFAVLSLILILTVSNITRLSAQCNTSTPDAPFNGIDTDCDGLDALDLHMPAYIYLVEGKVFDLFYRNLFLSKHPIDYTCTVVTSLSTGVSTSEKWTITPTFAQIGEHAITLQIKDNTGKILASASSVARVAAAQTPASVTAKKIIVMGHSLVDQGIMPYYLKQLTNEPGNPSITHHGTRVSWSDNITKHEGKGGASWKYFIHNDESPLRFNQQVNIRHYFDQVIGPGANPDYFVIQLDGNDFCFTGQVTGAISQEIDDFIDEIYLADILPLITAIRTASPSTKIAVCLAAPANGRPNIFPNFFGPTSILNEHFRWQKIVNRIYVKYSQYFGGREDENISIIPIHMGVDDFNHFDDNDPVHPYATTTSNGYFSISRAIYGWMKHQMATSTNTCQVNAQVVNLTCHANQTYSNSNDDTFSYTLDVNGLNAGAQWSAIIAGVNQTGTIGTAKQVGPYLTTAGIQSFDISSTTNPTCKTKVTVSNAACSNGQPTTADLSLSITTPNTQPSLFTAFPVVYTVTNQSAYTAERIWIKIPRPTYAQLLSSNPIVASQGNFDWSFTQLWSVGNLPPNATATLSVSYFLTQTTSFPIYAQVYAVVQPDTDSKPANGNGTSALEDDEFALMMGQPQQNPCAPDATPPNFTFCPSNQSLTTTGTSTVANWTAPTVTDLCPGAVTLTSTHTSGTSFLIGNTTVTFTARDAANNTRACSFTIAVSVQNPCSPDIAPPTIANCPSNQSLTTTGTSTVANWTAPTATDLCPGAVTLTSTHPSGSSFPIGSTNVTYTARDAANNTRTCSFTITVSAQNTGSCQGNLIQNPGFEQELSAWAGTGGEISADAATGTKALRMCTAGTNMRQTIPAQAGQNYTLNWSGKTAGQGQNIAVATKFLTSSWTVAASDFYVFDSPNVYANASRQNTAPAGTAYIEISFYKQNAGCIVLDDICLSSSTGGGPCSPDQTAPVLSACPTNMDLSTSGTSAIANWTVPTATDACPGAVNITSNFNSGASFPIGSTTVVYTARDLANNTKTCAFTVQVSQAGAPNCAAVSSFPWEDWIASIQVGNITKASGKSTYSDHSATIFTLTKSGANTVQLTTGYSYFTYDEFWRVYIDYNHDQIYQANEKAYEGIMTKPADGTASKAITGSFNIPASALLGNARMRVIMTRNQYAEACGNIATGEVEDFTVNIAQTLASSEGRLSIAQDAPPSDLTIYPNPTDALAQIAFGSWAGEELSIHIINQLGVEISKYDYASVQSVEQLDFSAFADGVYFLRVAAKEKRPITLRILVQHQY
jgi:hypothetical protein